MKKVKNVNKNKFWGSLIIGIILIAIIAWLFRPWVHGFAMGLYRNPIILEILLVWGILYFTVLRKRSTGMIINTLNGPKTVQFNLTAFLVLFALIFASPIFSSIAPQLYIVNNFDFDKIDTLPETKDNIRLMPYEVANRYSKDSLQLSQFKLGTENIANVDGKLSWMFPLIPDGGILSLIKQNKGIVVVDATTQEKSTEMVWKDLAVGEGMSIFDNIWWKVFKQKYFVDVDDPYYIPYEGDIYTVISLVKYSYKHYFGLLYTVPEFGGVVLMNSAGEINVLSPKEAKENPILKDNRLFPESLARYYAESYVYNKGLINKWFIHEDQIDIQDVPGTRSLRNYQPYLMDTSEGLKWFISAEPYGQSHGIFKIFIMDAIDGKISVYELPIDDTLTGPIKVRDFVRQANPVVDWNRFSIIEPLPFIRSDELFWKVVVAPSDAAGVAYQAFVNAKTNKVTEIEKESDVSKFIAGEIKETDELEKESEEKSETSENLGKDEVVDKIKTKLDEINKLLAELEE